MSDPLSNMVNAVNQVVSPHLENIGKNINEQIDRKERRRQLEEKVIVDHARLRLQEANYEAGLRNTAKRTDLYEQKANAELDLDRRKQEAAAYEDLHKVTTDQLSALEARRVVAEMDGVDTGAIDTEAATLKARKADLEQRMIGAVMPTQQERIVPREPGPQLNMQLPQRTNEELGFEGYNNASFQRGGNATTLTPNEEGRIEPSNLHSYMTGRIANSRLNGMVPADGAKYGITTGAPEEWANYFVGLAEIESGFNPGNDKGDRGRFKNAQGVATGSNGLFQLSQHDARTDLYKFRDTDFSMEELLNPEFNADIAVRIHEKLISDDGVIAEGGRGAARYWGPLGRGVNPVEQDSVVALYEQSSLPSGGGIATGGSGLFPGDAAPDQSIPVAEPIPTQPNFYGPAQFAPEEAPDETQYSFDDEPPLLLDDEKATGGSMLEVASVPQNGLIIDDQQSMNGQPAAPTGSPEPKRKKLTDQEALKTYAGIVRITDPKLREQTLSIVSNKMREANPEVFDDRVRSIAQEFVETGSRTDFEKAIPEEVVALVGKDRAIGIFQEMSTQYKVEQQRVKQVEEKTARARSLQKDLDDAELNLLRAKDTAAGKPNPEVIKKHASIVERLTNELGLVNQELQGLSPQPAPTVAAEPVPEKAPALSETAVDLIRRAKESAPAALPAPTSKPTQSSLVGVLSQRLGIKPEFLDASKLPDEPFGFFEKLFNGGDIVSAVDSAMGAYVQSEKARYAAPDYGAKQTDFDAVKTFLSEGGNLDAVNAFAAELGYSIGDYQFKPATSSGAGEFAGLAPRDETDNKAALKAMLASPADAVALVKTFLKKDLRNTLRSVIVTEADRLEQEKKQRALQVLQSGSIQSDL